MYKIWRNTKLHRMLLCLLWAGIGLQRVSGAVPLSLMSKESLKLKSMPMRELPSRREKKEVVLVRFKDESKVRAIPVEAQDVRAAAVDLGRRPEILFAEPNRTVSRQYTPSDSYLANQWHHEVLQSEKCWELDLGSSSVKVAIVDWPFQMNHPDLESRSAAGWDVVNDIAVPLGSVPSSYTYDDHSTMTAGLVAAAVDNGLGVAGIGNFTVVPVNNTYPDFDSEISDIYNAVVWAADNGVRVVNVSWEGVDSAVLNDAGLYLRQQTDGILVMAGENGSGPVDYTNHPYIVAVSMTDSSDQLRSHSGNHIDFSAPGYSVYSTSTISGYVSASGTSFSAPLVSGLIAMLFSVDPDLTAEGVLEILRNTVDDLGAPGWDPEFGWGRINGFRAVALALSQKAPVVVDLLQDSIVSTGFLPGVNYTLWSSDSLTASNWIKEPVALSTNDTNIGFIMPDHTNAARFFRISAEVE
jgi:subtilisin family serine protease